MTNNRMKRVVSKMGFKFDFNQAISFSQGFADIVWLDAMPDRKRLIMLRQCFPKCISDQETQLMAAHYAARIQRLWWVDLELHFTNVIGSKKVHSMEYETQDKCLISKLQDFTKDQIDELKSKLGPNDTFSGVNWTAVPVKEQS